MNLYVLLASLGDLQNAGLISYDVHYYQLKPTSLFLGLPDGDVYELDVEGQEDAPAEVRYILSGLLTDALAERGLRREARPTSDEIGGKPIWMVAGQAADGWIHGNARYAETELEALIACCLAVSTPAPLPADTTAADAGWQSEPDPEVVPVGEDER